MSKHPLRRTILVLSLAALSAGAFAQKAAKPRAGRALAHQAAAHPGGFPRRLDARPGGPHHRRAAVEGAGPAGDRGKPRRRRRQHRRRHRCQGHRQPHHRRDDQRQHDDRQAAQPGHAVRSAEGPGADQPDRHRAAAAHRAGHRAVQQRAGVLPGRRATRATSGATARRASAPWDISAWNCSRPRPTSTRCTCPTPAIRRSSTP